jgi:hypothetical protein
MDKYFVTHSQAVALKELGFDEPCIARFIGYQFSTNTLANWYNHNGGEISNKMISAPLKSQVFEWFRKNHLLGHEINCPFISYSGKLSCIKNEGRYELYITDEEQLSLPEDIFYSTDYFEAESKAIDKLIEIVKNK